MPRKRFRFQIWHLQIVGTVLLIQGAVLPFLMVIRIIKVTFFLAFLSYISTLLGGMLFYIGYVYHTPFDLNE